MKAMTRAESGSADVLGSSDVPRPDPGPGEVLVRVGAASPNPWDWHFMRGLPHISRTAGAGLGRRRTSSSVATCPARCRPSAPARPETPALDGGDDPVSRNGTRSGRAGHPSAAG